MRLPIYQIDAFTSTVFRGNPAAVVPLASWLPDALLQAIALENNLSETAFFVPDKDRYHVRWFTPTVEVDLCGHATLASAWVIFTQHDSEASIHFDSRSGPLTVRREGTALVMDLPANSTKPVADHRTLNLALNTQACEVRRAHDDYLVVVDDQATLQALRPDLAALRQIEARGIIVTAAADQADYDFVSRFFCPAVGIDEDPVTGSAHCTLAPFWAKRLGKTKLKARQLSARGGELYCQDHGDRVEIGGHCTPYLRGEIQLP